MKTPIRAYVLIVPFTLILLHVVSLSLARAQTSLSAVVAGGIVFVEYTEEPQFPGGQKALTRYLDQQVRYPKAAAKAGITGRVFASFVIDTVGRISQAAILRGLGYGCDEEAIRVVEQMPRWIPGRLYNRPVSVKYNLPILFSPK
jgi:periplasmic protein TonB